jgi:toxin-antitoxin system PIN domain toxin
MIVPDANLLIYAHDAASPQHDKARAWWEGALSGSEPVGLPWVVVLAVTRLLTHPNVCENPLSPEQVRSIVEHWVSFPHVRIIHLSENALGRFFDLLEDAGMGGNLTTDALIALHSMEHSAVIASNDRDFDRFAGIKRINPLS